MGMSSLIKLGPCMYSVWDGKMDGTMHILFSQFCIGFFVFSFFLLSIGLLDTPFEYNIAD